MKSSVFSQVGKNLPHFYRWGNCGGAESVRNTPKINNDIFLWQSEESSSDLLPCSGGTFTTTPPSLLCKPARAGLRDNTPKPVAPAIPQREKQCPESMPGSLKGRSETHHTHLLQKDKHMVTARVSHHHLRHKKLTLGCKEDYRELMETTCKQPCQSAQGLKDQSTHSSTGVMCHVPGDQWWRNSFHLIQMPTR